MSARAAISLAPGFSWVYRPLAMANRFNGLHRVTGKPLKRLSLACHGATRLKPGANERTA